MQIFYCVTRKMASKCEALSEATCFCSSGSAKRSSIILGCDYLCETMVITSAMQCRDMLFSYEKENNTVFSSVVMQIEEGMV